MRQADEVAIGMARALQAHGFKVQLQLLRDAWHIVADTKEQRLTFGFAFTMGDALRDPAGFVAVESERMRKALERGADG